MTRLFIGTYLDKESQTALGKLPLLNERSSLSWTAQLKWLKENKLHLTWLFLGVVEAKNIPELSQELSAIAEDQQSRSTNLPARTLTYDCLELWYAQDKPRHLVLTPSEAASDLLSFVQTVRNRLAVFASADVRQQAIISWKPHITLGRLSENKGPINLPETVELSHQLEHRNSKGKELSPTTLMGLSEVLPLHHSLKEVSLIESKDRDGTHHYEALQTYSLI